VFLRHDIIHLDNPYTSRGALHICCTHVKHTHTHTHVTHTHTHVTHTLVTHMAGG
jgi:hypothetical protein